MFIENILWGYHCATYSGFKIRNKTWPFTKYFMHIHIVEYYIAIKKNKKGFWNILIGNNLQDIMSNQGEKVKDNKYARIWIKREEIHIYVFCRFKKLSTHRNWAGWENWEDEGQHRSKAFCILYKFNPKVKFNILSIMLIKWQRQDLLQKNLLGDSYGHSLS